MNSTNIFGIITLKILYFGEVEVLYCTHFSFFIIDPNLPLFQGVGSKVVSIAHEQTDRRMDRTTHYRISI